MNDFKALVNAIQEAKRQAFKENMLANAVFLNPKYIKINSHRFMDRFRDVTEIPPMICGLEMHFVVDLPDNVSFAVTNIPKKRYEDRWISIEEKQPEAFVSVLGYMTDAEPFPPIRECYLVNNGIFFFPALNELHPVSHWMPMPEAPKGVKHHEKNTKRNDP